MSHKLIAQLTDHVLGGALLNQDQGCALAELSQEHTLELLFAANSIKRFYGQQRFTCSITNAKSGRCSQDCSFCAQSAHYETGVSYHPLLPVREMINRGLAMHKAGASCYSLVTSGLMLSTEEIETICECLAYLARHTDLCLSASLGILTDEFATRLTQAGLKRYHHNLETARSHFPSICTTHAYDDDIATVQLAHKHGLKVCSGGIFGLGETFVQRIELATTLQNLLVDTVPLNFLSPIKGTPLENSRLLTPHDALKSIALFRFMLPQVNITIAGGRERVLGDYQSWLPLAGANGMMIGNYLTLSGRSLSQDDKMLEQGQWI